MECKFITNGLAIAYDQVIKPCCEWDYDKNWADNNHINNTSLINWHNKTDILNQKKLLDQDIWPTMCSRCEAVESQNRNDSMRGNGNSAYQHYSNNDISLEIRPGNTCNFACQTCWPEASSRVAQYFHQANLIDINQLNSHTLDNFDFLLPIKHRIKDVVLLGGEPFYDKACKKFIAWANDHLTANLTMFTNGSVIDAKFIETYVGKLTLVFSLDAYGRAAEYVRYGTVWADVEKNYLQARQIKKINTRVNITLSVYNYAQVEQLISFLCQDWPSVVTFGQPRLSHLKESSIPHTLRPLILESLERALETINFAKIESDQKSNAQNAIKDLIYRLTNTPYSQTDLLKWQQFTQSMDKLKNINAGDYCSFLSDLLYYKVD